MESEWLRSTLRDFISLPVSLHKIGDFHCSYKFSPTSSFHSYHHHHNIKSITMRYKLDAIPLQFHFRAQGLNIGFR